MSGLVIDYLDGERTQRLGRTRLLSLLLPFHRLPFGQIVLILESR